MRLVSYHNLYFLLKLTDNIRKAIEEDRFLDYKKEFYSKFGIEDMKLRIKNNIKRYTNFKSSISFLDSIILILLV